MIYRQSTDPVFLKKINIDVWLLRDQLEEIVITRLKQNPEEKNFDDLISEFAPKSKPNLQLLKFEEEDSKSSPEEDGVNVEDENSTNPSDKNEKIVITQRLPRLREEKICKGKTFLGEIYMDKILFFSDRQFIEGQSIVIKFNVHETFFLNAEVTYSQAFSLKNRVISDTNLPFRICATFTFLKDGERTLLRKFLENIEFRENLTNSQPKDDKDDDSEQAENTAKAIPEGGKENEGEDQHQNNDED
tara:strand:+ start:407 stop:1144 length:738 start_codon:yes stop_codon:yes gene_type:complete